MRHSGSMTRLVGCLLKFKLFKLKSKPKLCNLMTFTTSSLASLTFCLGGHLSVFAYVEYTATNPCNNTENTQSPGQLSKDM